jgi:hypothetical protein
MMLRPDLASARWRKSSFSMENGECVEIARGATWVAMRDSKDPGGPALVVDRGAMERFLAGIRCGQFDCL